MKPIYKIIILLPAFLAIQSCSLFNTTPSPDAYLGGEIVNPLSDEVVLSYNSTPLDTAELNGKNRFKFHLPQVKPGIYSFTHGVENQIVYLEQGDSTIIYVNTLDFDNSLNFSGRGSEKNNFLIDMFLLNEKNNEYILSYYMHSPESFAKQTDSIKAERQHRLKTLKEKNNFSEDFMRLANMSIDYEYYDLRERYSYLVNRYNRKFINEIPADFHAYRKEIDFSNKELENYYGYLRLIDNYLKNLAIETCQTNINPECFDSYTYGNIRRRLELIDSLTTNPNLKTRYFGRLGAQGILCSKNESQIGSIFQVLKEESFPEEKMRSVKILAAIQRVYLPGKKAPKVKLVNADFQEVILTDLVKKPTVFFNWSAYSPKHHQLEHETVARLRKEYPEVNFIGLNIDAGEPDIWRKTLTENRYEATSEYQLQRVPIERKYLSFFLNKLLFVDASGTVVMGDVKMDSPEFAEKMQDFLSNKKKKEIARISNQKKPI